MGLVLGYIIINNPVRNRCINCNNLLGNLFEQKVEYSIKEVKMGILDTDMDDGMVSEEEADKIDCDPALYLDRFPDPFQNHWNPMMPNF